MVVKKNFEIKYSVYAFVPNLIDWVMRETGLEPVMSMETCHDGVINKRVPVPDIKPSVQKLNDLVRKEDSSDFKCADPNGNGEFHFGNGEWKTNGYPKPYAHNQHCYYCVSPTTPGSFVEVTIHELQERTKM